MYTAYTILTSTVFLPHSKNVRTGFDIRELAYIWRMHKGSDCKMEIISPLGGEAHIDPHSLKEAEGDSVVKEFLQDKEAKEKYQNTKRIDEILMKMGKDDKVAILIGGHGALIDFSDSFSVSHLLCHVWKNNGIIGAIAQGVVGLINLRVEKEGELLIKNKRITCASDDEEKNFSKF
jgi:putative intracellular protease/amidase